MKVYLQRTKDQMYFAGNGNWCKTRKSALSYPFSALALMDAIKMKDRVELVLVFDESSERYELRLHGPEPRV